MKLSVFKNDKSTLSDELILTLIVIVLVIAGLFLYLYSSFFGVVSAYVKNFSLVLIILAIMYIPCIIYRLFSNEK